MIQMSDVSKSLENETVLNDITIEFREGNVYLLTGHNGSGKTMMLKMICGLLEPSKGKIIRDRNYSYGVIIENPNFFENETVASYMKLITKYNSSISWEEVEQYLKIFGLYEQRDKKIQHFSWGMKQRLALCQVVMKNPDVLVLDEPFNLLDSENYDEALNLMRDYKRQGKIVIIAVHGADEDLMKLVDRRIIMENGGIKAVSDSF